MVFSHYLFPAIFSFVFTVALILIALKVFPKLGLVDRPKKYGLTRKAIPYYGGLVLYVTFLVSTLLFLSLTPQVIGLLIGVTMMMLVSFFDDLLDLSPWVRLCVQILAAVVIVISGIGVYSITNPFGGVIPLDTVNLILPFGGEFVVIPLFSALFTIVWVVVITNTMNFLDGLNGLPSGVTTIAAFTLFLLSVRPDFHSVDQGAFAVLAIIIAAMCFAFWIFDFYPAKILMGDTGSMMLGFILAVMAIFAGGKIATAFLVFGFPLLDMVWVMVRRIFFEKRSPMIGDKKHFHHRLLDIGLSDRRALLLIYFICSVFGFLAVNLGSRSKLFAIIAMAVLMAVLGFVVVKRSRV